MTSNLNKPNKVPSAISHRTKKPSVEQCDEYEMVINGMLKIYTIIKEIDLSKVHPKFYMEDWDEEKDHWDAPEEAEES